MAGMRGIARPDLLPVRLEVELAVGLREALEEVRTLEGQGAIDPADLGHLGQRRLAAAPQPVVQQLGIRHGEARVRGAEPPPELAHHEAVGARLPARLDQLGAVGDVRVAEAVVQVVVLDEHGGGQQDVGEAGGRRHELLLHGEEQVLPAEPAQHLGRIRRHRRRVGVLHQHGLDRRPAAQRLGLAHQHRADARLVEDAHGGVEHVQAVQQRGVDAPEFLVVGEEEGAAALLGPRPGHGRQAGHGVHGGGAVARAREAEAGADEALLRAAVQAGERHDVVDRQPGDLGGPLRRARQDVRLGVGVEIGEPSEVGAVDQPLGQQHVHDGQSQGAHRCRA